MPANFPMLLAELKRKNSMTVLKKYYQDEWEFYDLLIGLTNHKDFKQACIDKSFSEDFKNDLDHYIKLTNQAREAISKYFKRKDIELQAYSTKTNGALNINLINYDRSEPMKISDILQQEKNISELNIYCNKKHDIHAYRKDKERHYEFTKGAYYEMTSTWPADKSGKTFMCTMVMSVSNDGITKIEEFNGKKFNDESDKLLSEEDMKLIEQNKELYIQGLSLYDAVKALLEKNKNAPLPDVVLTANNNLQNKEPTSVNRDEKLPDVVLNGPIQDEKVDGQLDLKNDAPRFPTSNDASTQTVQQVEMTQTEEVAVQAEINSPDQKFAEAKQEIEGLKGKLTEDGKRIAELEEQDSNSQSELKKVKQKNVELERQNNDSQNILERAKQTITVQEKKIENLQVEKNKIHEESREKIEKLNKELAEVNLIVAELKKLIDSLQSVLTEDKRITEELEKKNNSLQSELAEAKQKNTELQSTQVQELESARKEKENLKKKLDIANAGKEELTSKLRELQKELKEKKRNLEDELDQLERSNKSIKEREGQLLQKISDLKEKLLLSEEKKQTLGSELENTKAEKEKLNEELTEDKRIIEELNKQNDSLQDKLEMEEKKHEKLQAELKRKDEKLTSISANLQEKTQELENVRGEKENLKKKLEAANAKKEKLEDELKRLEEEAGQVEWIDEKEDNITNLKLQMRELESEYNTRLKSGKQEIEKLEWKIEELTNELKLKDEQFKKLREHVRVEVEQEIVDQYGQQLAPKFKEYEDEIEKLTEIIADKTQTIENLRSNLQDKEEGKIFRNQTEVWKKEMHSSINKQKVSNDQAKNLYKLTGNIDVSEEEKSRSASPDSALYNDDEGYDENHCNSALSSIRNPIQVSASQGQCSNYSSVYPQNSFS